MAFAGQVHNYPTNDPGVRSRSTSGPWAWGLYPDTPDFPVVVRGDNLTHYQGVMEVLDVLGRVGISQVGLATKSGK